MKLACLLLLAGVLPPPALAEISGRVVAVTSGDSLTILVNEREQVKVRLLGIDAPEPYQDFGKQSQSGLAAYTIGRDVRIDGENKDRQGHVLARVWVAEAACRQAGCPKSMDVGLAQVAAGWAWHDARNGQDLPSADRRRYSEAEFMAKIRRLGLWAGKNPAVPRAWQHDRLDE